MQLDTGRIEDMTEGERKAKERLGDLFAPVDMDDATPKQRQDRKVSLHDHRSLLGEQLTRERAKRGMTKNAVRRLRRQGKLI